MTDLLVRADELAVLNALLGECRAGAGGAVLLEGPAGIGKSALLEELAARARGVGVRVLTARGGELERDFPFAVTRQLFEPAVTAADAQDELLEGAAELAAPVLAPRPVADAAGTQAFAIVHGLYWLATNLTRERPLVLVVDDAHWSDPSSLRFLLHTVQRLEGLPIGIAIAARPDEPDAESELLDALALGGARPLRPATLSASAVGALVAAGLGEPAEAFVAACHGAFGGNPFLARELVATRARDGVAPTAASTGRVATLGPEGVRRAVALRLGRLPAAAGALARATAILGEQTSLRLAAQVADLDETDAVAAVDLLVGIDVLGPELPLAFVHPIVRTAVYEQISATERTRSHRRAAALLADDGAEPERVAIHLLACGPTGDPWVVESLRRAATTALSRGAPEVTRAYLERALAEPPPPSDRPGLLHELGRAGALVRDPAAAAHLREALRLAKSPARRGAISQDLIELLVYGGEWDAVLEQIASALAELGDDPIALHLKAYSVAALLYTPRLAGRFGDEEGELRELATSADPAARPLALAVAAALAWRLDDPSVTLDLVRRGLDDGRLLAERGAEFIFLPQAMWTLLGLDQLDLAAEVAEGMAADAERRGSIVGVSLSASFQGWVRIRRGDLRGAEARLRVGFDLAVTHELAFVIPAVFHCGLDALLERPDLGDLVSLATSLELPPDARETISGAMLFEVRGRARLATGDRAAGSRTSASVAGCTRPPTWSTR